ncbi:NB-ARC domain-containing protein [Streptomyces gibsoniae]|uniref:Helix-turn-helix domain-containing protein n=1 Tax=Streptomyces gibsoniae TaxID=3075529 RepID=A0ABU2TZD2_9ACTN|nr:NB-ARC domain-containing protein [Streptomyces sp. DSM 41699]MDT0466215.1 helix-turn-helix domain-containing protein [Streptomyces sp. DSM 41699]
MADQAQNFGALLRRLRLAASLTIEELSEASGVSVRGIGELERGRRGAPQRRTVAALADGLAPTDADRERLLAAARAGRTPGYSPVGVRTSPRGIDDFVGREQELAQLAALAREHGQLAVEQGEMADGDPARDSAPPRRDPVPDPAPLGLGAVPGTGPGQPVVVAVSGSPGTGKTTLALQAARQLTERFPDGQLVVDLRGMDEDPPTPAELTLRVLKALGVSDRDLARTGPGGHPGLYRQVLAGRRCLLVLDNARDEAQVRPLLPGTGSGMVIVTSRRMLTGLESVHRIALGELTPREAAALLTSLVGPERAEAEPAALAEVARRCAHLPLALRVAGNWLAVRTGWTVRLLADRLAQEEQRLHALETGEIRVAAAFDLSYRQLTPEAARMFRRLCLVEGPTAAAGAARLTGQPVFDAEDTLEELVETGLLGTDQDRYRLHDLLRLFARSRLESEESPQDAARARAALHEWLLETAVVAGRWYEPDHGAPPPTWQGTVDLSSADAARRWLQAEGADWLAALRTAAATGRHRTVVDVAEALHWFSDQWIFWGHWPEVFGTAAASAEALDDPVVAATQLNYHAWALLLCEGRPRDSLVPSARALEAAERAGDTVQQAWAHHYGSWALRLLGEYTASAERNAEAARLFEAAGDLHGALQARIGRGSTLLDAGLVEEALASDRDTLAFLDSAGDRIKPHIALMGRLTLHMVMGRAYYGLGRLDDAVTHLGTAIELGRESGNTGLESRCLTYLGTALVTHGRPVEARAVFTRCIALGAGADPQRIAQAQEQLALLNADGRPPEGTAGTGAEASAVEEP